MRGFKHLREAWIVRGVRVRTQVLRGRSGGDGDVLYYCQMAVPPGGTERAPESIFVPGAAGTI
jgi:hypothetical protein